MPVSWGVFAPQGSDFWFRSGHFEGNPLKRVSKRNNLYLTPAKSAFTS